MIIIFLAKQDLTHVHIWVLKWKIYDSRFLSLKIWMWSYFCDALISQKLGNVAEKRQWKAWANHHYSCCTQVHKKSSLYTEVWFTRDSGLLSLGKLWMWRWGMDPGHEDWWHKGLQLSSLFYILLVTLAHSRWVTHSYFISENIPLWFSVLEQQKCL